MSWSPNGRGLFCDIPLPSRNNHGKLRKNTEQSVNIREVSLFLRGFRDR